MRIRSKGCGMRLPLQIWKPDLWLAHPAHPASLCSHPSTVIFTSLPLVHPSPHRPPSARHLRVQLGFGPAVITPRPGEGPWLATVHSPPFPERQRQCRPCQSFLVWFSLWFAVKALLPRPRNGSRGLPSPAFKPTLNGRLCLRAFRGQARSR